MNDIIQPNVDELYKDYIQRILSSRENIKIKGVYMERHHIQPKCLGGLDDEDNLIYLFPQEHYYAHKLLAQENPDNESLLYAWWMMSNKKKVSIDENEYAVLKEKFHEQAVKANIGEKNPFFGKKHTEEYKKFMSEVNIGKKLSQDTKNKLSKITCERYKYEANPFKGKHHTEETKELIRSKHKCTPVLCEETGVSYASAREAQRKTGVRQSGISRCLQGEQKTAGGFHWILIDLKHD